MRHSTEGAVVRRERGKTHTIHRNRDRWELRRIAARILPGNTHIHECIQRMRKHRRIDSARVSHTEAVIPNAEIQNRASVIGVGVKQGDKGITIPEGIVQSLDLQFQTTCRKRPVGIQCVSQLTCIGVERVDNDSDIVIAGRSTADAVDCNHKLGSGSVNRCDRDGIRQPVALNHRGNSRVRRVQRVFPHAGRQDRETPILRSCRRLLDQQVFSRIRINDGHRIRYNLGAIAIDGAHQIEERSRCISCSGTDVVD